MKYRIPMHAHADMSLHVTKSVLLQLNDVHMQRCYYESVTDVVYNKHTGPWELYSALGNTRNSLIASDSMIHFNHSFMQLKPRVTTTTFHFLEYACAVIESSRYNSEGTAHDPCSLLVGLNSVVV